MKVAVQDIALSSKFASPVWDWSVSFVLSLSLSVVGEI